MRNRSTFIAINPSLKLTDIKTTISSRMTISGHYEMSFYHPGSTSTRSQLLTEIDWQACCQTYKKYAHVEIVVTDHGQTVKTSDAEEWIVVDSAIDDEEYFRGLGTAVWARIVGYVEKRISDEKLRQDAIPRKQFKDLLAKSLQEIQGGLSGFKEKIYDDVKSLKSQLKLQRIVCLMELKSKSEAPISFNIIEHKIADPKIQPQKKLSHYGVTCDQCKLSPIVGVRYKSIHRRNYDLCEACHDNIDNKEDVYIALREIHPSKANHLVHLSRAIVKPGQISSELNLLQNLHQWTDEFVDMTSILNR
jgi:Zinc finger, ZZ type